MSTSNPTTDFFQTLAGVLLRSWVLGFALLFVWSAAAFFTGDFIYSVHAQMFGLSRHELDLIFYCGMGLLKVLVLVFFFFPWIAVKLALRHSAASAAGRSG
jgi:hypothetical protein